MEACGASNRAKNRDRRSSLKAGGTWRDLIHRQIILISAVDQKEL